MSIRMREHSALLRRLYKASPKDRKNILKDKCDRPFVECISECCKNVLRGNVPMNRSQLINLRRHKRMIRKLSLKKSSLKNKKRIIQTGGFLGALLGPIVSILGSLFKQ
jgi:hypothetical protein